MALFAPAPLTPGHPLRIGTHRQRRGAGDPDLSWPLQTFGLALRIPLSAFAYHVGGARFQTIPSAEMQARIEQSDNFPRNKLAAFNCPKCPTSSQLWGCDILADRAPANR